MRGQKTTKIAIVNTDIHGINQNNPRYLNYNHKTCCKERIKKTAVLSLEQQYKNLRGIKPTIESDSSSYNINWRMELTLVTSKERKTSMEPISYLNCVIRR